MVFIFLIFVCLFLVSIIVVIVVCGLLFWLLMCSILLGGWDVKLFCYCSFTGRRIGFRNGIIGALNILVSSTIICQMIFRTY